MDDWLRREVGPWFYIERVNWTTHCQALYDRMVALDYRLASEGRIGGEHGRFAYFETEQDPGTMIEISDGSDPKGVLFERLHDRTAEPRSMPTAGAL